MPSILLTSTCSGDLSAQESWPDDVVLYQPFEAEQIILPELAHCMSVKCFLNMCKLSYKVETRSNAVNMSPSGEVPFIKCGSFIVADIEPIMDFLKPKGISLSSHLKNAEKADMRAYMSLIKMVLHNAEIFISWYDKKTFYEFTKPRFGKFLPWPINQILSWEKKWDVRKKLKAVDWHNKTKQEVYEEVNNCCHSLSEKLGTQNYFFGDKPTELDAIAFGHLFSILSTQLPDTKLNSVIRQYQNLVDLCLRIDSQYFQKSVEEEEAVLEFDQ